MAGSVRKPHPALTPYVEAYVGYHEVLDARAVHHGVASERATVILAFDEPIDVGWPGETGSGATYWTLASGLHTKPALIVTHGFQHGIQLDLTPLGVRALLGVPAAEIAALMVDHLDLPLGVDAPKHAAIAGAGTWGERFDLLEAHLLSVLARRDSDPADRVRPEVGEAWRLLTRSRGGLAVEEVARRVGWSRRHLAARFAAEYGVGPKQAARLMRFSHARSLARSGCRLADAAHRSGFADQAHLSREWRALGGQTPTQALGQVFPIVQDGERPAVAGSPA
jgi:AraC-like DNA-binding protein